MEVLSREDLKLDTVMFWAIWNDRNNIGNNR